MGSLFFIIDLVVADIYVVHIRGVIVLRTKLFVFFPMAVSSAKSASSHLQTETVTIQLIFSHSHTACQDKILREVIFFWLLCR